MTTEKKSSSKTLLMVVVGLWVGVLLGALVIAVLVFTGVIPGLGGSNEQIQQEAPTAKLESGVPAIDFTLPDLQGNLVSLSDFQGKVTAFNFWATWCIPCIEEMPMFQQYAQQYPQFNMIGVDAEESAETVSSFLETFEISYPIVLDEDAEAASNYQVMVLPTTIFVDEAGEIRFRHYGIMTEEQLVYYLTTLGVIPE